VWFKNWAVRPREESPEDELTLSTSVGVDGSLQANVYLGDYGSADFSGFYNSPTVARRPRGHYGTQIGSHNLAAKHNIRRAAPMTGSARYRRRHILNRHADAAVTHLYFLLCLLTDECSFIHSFIVKSTQQTCMHDHKNMNKNNNNTKANFETQNTLAMPKTRTESSYVFERGNKHFQEFYSQDGGENCLAWTWNEMTSLSPSQRSLI